MATNTFDATPHFVVTQLDFARRAVPHPGAGASPQARAGWRKRVRSWLHSHPIRPTHFQLERIINGYTTRTWCFPCTHHVPPQPHFLALCPSDAFPRDAALMEVSRSIDSMLDGGPRGGVVVESVLRDTVPSAVASSRHAWLPGETWKVAQWAIKVQVTDGALALIHTHRDAAPGGLVTLDAQLVSDDADATVWRATWLEIDPRAHTYRGFVSLGSGYLAWVDHQWSDACWGHGPTPEDAVRSAHAAAEAESLNAARVTAAQTAVRDLVEMGVPREGALRIAPLWVHRNVTLTLDDAVTAGLCQAGTDQWLRLVGVSRDDAREGALVGAVLLAVAFMGGAVLARLPEIARAIDAAVARESAGVRLAS